MNTPSTIVQVQLSDGTEISIEARPMGERQISAATLPFQQAVAAISSIARDIAQAVQQAKPDKAQVKFGLEIALESKGLTALLAKGSSKANLEVTLEWNNS